MMRRGNMHWLRWVPALVLGALAGCGQERTASAPTPPPVGHYEGSLQRAGQADIRVTLDIRHPSPGHYAVELTAPTAPTLNFVADTVLFSQQQLLLRRPGQSTETLKLTLEGDFWRGTLALDSLQATTLLVKRGSPTPSTYRVEELPQQAGGSAWLYAPADVSTLGPALALLPDAATAAVAPLWADALAREGNIVLLLPALDSASFSAETRLLQTSLRLLRNTSGADTANVGVWAAGPRAATDAVIFTQPVGPKAAFFIIQNVMLNADSKAAFHLLAQNKKQVLGLYGGKAMAPAATALRGALGGRRNGQVVLVRDAGADLLVPRGWAPAFGPGLPGVVVQWLRER